ncbi:transmembrane protein, putative (macronuclear) [Tetrahymena thermophila SB210]|uniref:Transmembrane protein, putative n=1 Tax=Tetrahymena thermophila (strain SB210) TaxID=312017 RepID=W7XJ43_TETTS|nr:transmembrane protein, putative [Tetrahymena thermophila SB210]EWS75196.1 transmembrane protein, putative [Tetrahymena thermophila SB210]|eukprot:XP_012652187.1 transmembrane protein, putative [Tetrahymena thermophila SB210]
MEQLIYHFKLKNVTQKKSSKIQNIYLYLQIKKCMQSTFYQQQNIIFIFQLVAIFLQLYIVKFSKDNAYMQFDVSPFIIQQEKQTINQCIYIAFNLDFKIIDAGSVSQNKRFKCLERYSNKQTKKQIQYVCIYE